MNKAGLVDALAAKTGLTKKDVGRAIDALIEILTAELAAGNKVSLVGFGTFEARDREQRKGRNPRTGEEVLIPGRIMPVFRAGKALKDAVS